MAQHAAEIGRGVEVARKHAVVLEQLEARLSEHDTLIERVRKIGAEFDTLNGVEVDAEVVATATDDARGGDEGRA